MRCDIRTVTLQGTDAVDKYFFYPAVDTFVRALELHVRPEVTKYIISTLNTTADGKFVNTAIVVLC